ncbi:MAG: polyribonucleotide nucleotidyltransferase [Nitrospirota bacterium]|nr:polyribonucleotide nucleotidyltransferase [Nitrospirota bacterium]
MERIVVSTNFGDAPLSLELGGVARQASGACLARHGDSVVLATCCVAQEPRESGDFIPLTVDYVQMTYAAGKIPGGFFKREGRPTEREVLSSRFIDRSIRPLIPKGFNRDIQIIVTVLSSDLVHDTGVLAMIAASCAVHISEVPFTGPIAGVRVGYDGNTFSLNPPSFESAKNSDAEAKENGTAMDMVVASTQNAVIMVEGGMLELEEEAVLQGILFGYEQGRGVIEIQEEVRKKAGKPKLAFEPPNLPEEAKNLLSNEGTALLTEALSIPEKKARNQRLYEVRARLMELLGDDTLAKRLSQPYLFELERHIMRKKVLEDGIRIDNREPKGIRNITIEVPFLPRTHGSALFTRGETQALVTVTLGTWVDEQKIELLEGDQYKKFMLHYNFPPFSVGEVKFLRSPSRREVGHGHLAERALGGVVPGDEQFPYTIRVVSDIFESNGSSSMATVCGASLALMDAGVPISAAVAGIAMGLIKEGDDVVILSDILGDEDHLGDMDFKVAGTRKGITAFQMDTKIKGVDAEILRKALLQAKEGRLHILDIMEHSIQGPREEISLYAPRIVMLQIKPEKIREVIGPGGKMIKHIVDKTKAKIFIDDSGTVNIASVDKEACDEAIRMIQEIVREPEVGQIYMGKVKSVVDFGAFVEIMPGIVGLLHISQISNERVHNIHDRLKEGDELLVKVLEVDRGGKIRLSHKEAQETP